MTERYSIPDRFVYTWARLDSIEDGGLADPMRHVARALKQVAEGIITDALVRANGISEEIRRMQDDAKEAIAAAATASETES